MLAALPLAVLSLPAMFAAGLASSPHCAVMCGALQAGHHRGIDAGRSVGRLLAYALLGAAAASAGSWLLQGAEVLRPGHGLRVALMLVSLLWLLRTVRAAPAAARCCTPTRPRRQLGILSRMSLGFAAALMPCGLLYAAAGHALFAGSAPQGAMLLLAFGFGTTPGVQVGGWLWSRLGRNARSAPGGLAWIGVVVVAVILAAALPLGWAWCGS